MSGRYLDQRRQLFAAGKKVLLVDVTECPVERAQKNKENDIPAKRNGTR